MNHHQVLARKYRPKAFADVVAQPHTVQALSNALNQQHLHHAYLLTGIRGVGKTSLARIIAKCLNCERGISAIACGTCSHCQEIDSGRFPDVFEVDAASRTKVEDTREILDNVLYAPTKGRFKIYIIDEVHMLSGHSFNALLKTLEEPPEHVKFILATTDHHKLPATVLSRCLQFHLSSMQPSQISEHLRKILEQEKIDFEVEATELLGKAANGSMRDALSLLDQSIAYGNGKIITTNVAILLGTIEPNLLFDILNALQQKNGDQILKTVDALVTQGVDFSSALADLLSLLHQIALLQIIPEAPVESDKILLKKLAESLPPEDVQLFYQIGLIGQRDLMYAPSQRTGFEMTLLRMLAFYPEKSTPLSTASTPTPAKKIEPAAKTMAHDEWHELLPQLKLTGTALLLAQQCSLAERTEHELRLLLDSKQKPLLQPKSIERIQEAVQQQYQRKITVKIALGSHQNPTPADTIKQENQRKQQVAEKSIEGDKKIQELMQTFDAKIISITN